MYQINIDEEDQAAILIQKGFRGLIGRKAFAKELLQQERGKRRARRNPKGSNKPQPQSHQSTTIQESSNSITSDVNDDVHVVVIQAMKKPTIIKASDSQNRSAFNSSGHINNNNNRHWEDRNSSNDSLDPVPNKRNLTHIIEEDEDDLSLNDSLAINHSSSNSQKPSLSSSNKALPIKQEVLRQSKQSTQASWDAEISLEDSLDRHKAPNKQHNNHSHNSQQQYNIQNTNSNDDGVEEERQSPKVIVAKVRSQIPRAAPHAAASRVTALPLAASVPANNSSGKKEVVDEVVSSGGRGQGPPSVRDLAAASTPTTNNNTTTSTNNNASGSRKAEELQRMYRSDVVTQPKIKPQIIASSRQQQPVIKAAPITAEDDDNYDLYDNEQQYQYQQQEDIEEDELDIELEYQNIQANHKSHHQPSPPPKKKEQTQDDEDLQLKNEFLRAKQLAHQQQLQQLQQQKEAREQQEQQLKRQQQLIAKKKKEQQELEEQQRKEQERLSTIKEKERGKERERQRQLRRQQQQQLELEQQQQQLQYEQEQQQLRRRQQQQAEAAAAVPLKSIDLERKLLEEIAALDAKQRRLHEALDAHPANNNNNQKHISPKHVKQPSSARAAAPAPAAIVREKDPVKEREKKAFGPGARDVRPTANRAAAAAESAIPDPPLVAPAAAKANHYNQQQSKQKQVAPAAPPAPSPRAIVQEWKLAAQRESNNQHRPYPSQDDSSSQGGRGGGYEQQFSIKRDYQAMPQAHLESAPGYLHEFQRRKHANVILRSDSAKRDRQRRGADNGDDRSYHSAQEANRRQQQGQGQQQHESASLPPLLPAQRKNNLQPGQQYQHPLDHVNRRVDSRHSNHSAPI